MAVRDANLAKVDVMSAPGAATARPGHPVIVVHSLYV